MAEVKTKKDEMTPEPKGKETAKPKVKVTPKPAAAEKPTAPGKASVPEKAAAPKKAAVPDKTAVPKRPVAAPKKAVAAKRPVKAKPAKKRIKKGKAGKTLDIGIDVKLPKDACDDQFCPFHGSLPVRGQILEGIVVTDRMQKSVVVKRDYVRLNKKYERLEKRSNKYMVHSPPCLNVKTGDNVRIMECRPLSKTIAYVVIENKS